MTFLLTSAWDVSVGCVYADLKYLESPKPGAWWNTRHRFNPKLTGWLDTRAYRKVASLEHAIPQLAPG